MRIEILHNEYQLNIRKWSLSLVLFSLFLTAIPMQAENNIPAEKISIEEAFTLIGIEYGVHFNYDRAVVADVEVDYESGQYEKVEDVLQSVFSQTHLKYEVFDQRYVAVYRQDREGVESMKKMVSHFQEVISSSEEAYRRSERRIIPPLASLSMKNIFSKKLIFNVSGTVMDQEGEPLIGVNIQVKGTNQGTSTDFEGNFELEEVDEQAVLVVSYIGYQTQEIPLNGKTNIMVTLLSDSQLLDEVVVVGYGTQKKVNLTGAVSTISSEDLESRAVTKSSLALQGQMSGISVRQLSGNPRGNSATLTIRGQGTFSGAGSNPLVLVDGIESSIDNVDPNDIESISILKDAASAAIFGSKAANGVILIETKSGLSGAPQFSYNAYVGKQSPTTIPEMVNSWEYAMAANEATPGRFSEEEIQKFRSGSDPLNYPNFDHIDYLFGSGNGLQTKHDVSVRGGSESVRYMVSAGYYDQNAIIKKNFANRYNLRINLDTKLKDNLSFNIKLAGSKDLGEEPGPSLSTIILGAMRNSNAILGVRPDGYYGRNETLHPEADLNSKSFLQTSGADFYSNADMTWEIVDGLEIMGQVGYVYADSKYKLYQASYPVTENYDVPLNKLNNSWSNGSSLTMQSIIRYHKEFNNQSLRLLGGASSQTNHSQSISAYRDEFPNNEIYEIDAGATARGTQGGSASRNRLASFFGRLNYNIAEKYLFEANFRYDGSSRFPEDNRWGLFPSASVGWRVSEENFIQDAFGDVFDMKVRASWGQLGNQSIGNYPYQDLISLGQNYPFGSELSAGASVNTIANKEITWETTTITDVGLDLAMLSGRLNFTVDYFIKRTTDILYNVSVSNMLGATPSSTNAGTVSNRGWDFDIGFNNSTGNFTYGARALFSLVNNEVEKLANIDQDINRGLFIGHPIGSAYGYVSDGLFASDADVDNYATQPFSFLAEGGGIKYVDLSGPDGVPDGVVNSTYDRTIIGQPLPTSTYAFTLNAGFKNFDFNVLFQGEGGRKDMINLGQFFFPLENNGNVQREAFENRWTVENPDPNASYPRMKNVNTGFYRTNPVDYWYRDATFIRLKNIQLGYSLPQGILQNTFLNKVRFYVTGENLFTLTGYYEGWDPEMNTSGSFYPLTKLIVGGINVNF